MVDGSTIFVEAVDPRTVPVAGLKEAAKPVKASKLGSMDLLGAVLGVASREPLAEGTGSCWEEAVTTTEGCSRRDGLLWDAAAREANVEAMATVEEINKARSRTVRRRPAPWGGTAEAEAAQDDQAGGKDELVGPGEGVAPILLVARSVGGKPAYCGWDLIVPLGWSRAWWTTAVQVPFLTLIHAGSCHFNADEH